MDKAFDGQGDVCRALRDVPFDQLTLNKVVAEHYFREGRFDIGDLLVSESGVLDHEALKQPYVSMHQVLQQIQLHNLEPALRWAQEHQSKLALQPGGADAFEFRLHALNYMHLLTGKGGQQGALAYARAHFPPFRASHMRDIQRLMGCLVYVHSRPEATPYPDLLAPQGMWEEVALEFTRQACGVMGQAYESPLAVAVAAGAVALPALLKLADVMERNLQDLRNCHQLPIELELGPEFVFHSIFACPVSREQSTADNPPMLLPCNHVLCQDSVAKISKSRSRVFKCPYCPQEARADNLRPLVLPDAGATAAGMSGPTAHAAPSVPPQVPALPATAVPVAPSVVVADVLQAIEDVRELLRGHGRVDMDTD